MSAAEVQAGVAPEAGNAPEAGVAHPHPGPREYVKIAVILAVVTIAEVTIYYMKLRHGILIPALLGFSALKFSLVVLWFMHLKFDHRTFAKTFVTGLAIATTIYLVVLTTFGAFTR